MSGENGLLFKQGFTNIDQEGKRVMWTASVQSKLGRGKESDIQMDSMKNMYGTSLEGVMVSNDGYNRSQDQMVRWKLQ